MRPICEYAGCNEPARERRRVCVMHYNQSQAEYNRRRRAKARDNNDDEYVAQIEGADRIWKSILANEETVKRQEDGLRRLGFVRPQKEPTVLGEISRVIKEFFLGKLYALTGIKPLHQASTHPSIAYNAGSDAGTAYLQPPDAGTAHLPPEMKADPFASLEFMPEPDNMPITDIEEVYKGCMADRDNVSIAILGGSGQGKSYTARYLIEALHRRNKYNHFLMITNEGSYDKPNNDIAYISNVFQTICWNRLNKDEHDDVNEAIQNKLEEWAKGHTTMQTLVVIDDVSQELNDGEIKLYNLVSRGHHMRTDVIIIFHGVPKANVKALAPLKDNIEGVILTGTDLISTIYDRTQWFEKTLDKKEDIIRHCRSFAKRQARHVFINCRLRRDGRTLQEYCTPFVVKNALPNINRNALQRVSFTIGRERDAESIICDTSAYQPMLDYIQVLKSQHDKEMSLFEKYAEISKDNAKNSNNMDLEEEEDDGVLDREIIIGSRGDNYEITYYKDGSETCTCKSFQYRKWCKHIPKSKEKVCKRVPSPKGSRAKSPKRKKAKKDDADETIVEVKIKR